MPAYRLTVVGVRGNKYAVNVYYKDLDTILTGLPAVIEFMSQLRHEVLSTKPVYQASH